MRRCGRTVLHEPHNWYENHEIDLNKPFKCDGRTANEPMVGQLTVGELRAALEDEQDGAIVAVAREKYISPLQKLAEGRQKGRSVFVLDVWKRPDD